MRTGRQVIMSTVEGIKMSIRPKRVIAVDDNITNLIALKNILKSLYETYTASSAAKMFDLLTKVKPDLILLDVEMPELSGYEAAKLLKNNGEYKNIPVIFVTSMNDAESEVEGLELGAVDYIYKPYATSLLLKRIETHLLLAEHQRELEELNVSMQKRLISQMTQVLGLQNAVINIVADLVEFRDCVTGGHITRTEKYLQRLADKLLEENVYSNEISMWDMNYLLPSAQLHDVGKIAVSDVILNKASKLTDEEFEIMKKHTTIGEDFIKRMEKETTDKSFFEYANTFARSHHEKWDGSGYPKGLKGFDIPLEGRLMAIADVYDALVSERPYKAPLFPIDAARIIKEGSGTQFDPYVIQIFKMIEDDFAEISQIRTD